MISVRRAIDCIGSDVTSNISVWRDFFGFLNKPPYLFINALSIRNQVKLLQGKYFDVDIIRVSYEDFGTEEKNWINVAINDIRKIYRSVGLGIRRITHSGISKSEAGSFANINSVREIKKLTRKYRGPGPGMDVFLVVEFNVDDYIGYSAIGFNDKKDQYRFNGCVIGIKSLANLGVNFPTDHIFHVTAHEIGHGLGLKHQEKSVENLMYPYSPVGKKLDRKQRYKSRMRSQVTVIYDSDWIRNGCEIEI